MHHRHNGGRWHRRNNDIAGVIIGGIILNEIFRNNNQRYQQQCYDGNRQGHHQTGYYTEWDERVCN